MQSRWSRDLKGFNSCAACPSLRLGETRLSLRGIVHVQSRRRTLASVHFPEDRSLRLHAAETHASGNTSVQGAREHADVGSLEAHESGSYAAVPFDDLPAYLLRWVEALSRDTIQLEELQHLGPSELTEFLTECVDRDKRSAVSYGTRIVQHLLCLKYSSAFDFDHTWKHWSYEVGAFRQELEDACESQVIKSHLDSQLKKAYKRGVLRFHQKGLVGTIGTPAASFADEGLTWERLLGAWWPERLRNVLGELGCSCSEESNGMLEEMSS